MVLFTVDVLDAMRSYACSEPGSGGDCFPWGSEGPVAGLWRYESKAAHIGTGVASIVMLALAGLAPFKVRHAGVGLCLMAAGLLVGIGVPAFL